MRIRKSIISAFLQFTALSFIIFVGQGISADKKFIAMSGGPTGGTMYAMAVGMSKLINENLKNLDCTPETGGSVMNTRRAGTKKLDFGFATSDTAYHAIQGGPEFKGEKFPDIRAVFSGHVSYWHMVTVEGSGIKTIDDLRGKRVSIGYPGGSVEAVTKEILEVHGLVPDRDFKKFYARHTDVVTGLKDRTLDAGAIFTGVPSGALMDLATTHKMVLLPVSPEMQNKIIAKYAYYQKAYYEPGTYPKQTERIPTLVIGMYLITHKDTDEALVYSITKLIAEKSNELAEFHPAGKEWSLDTVKKGISIPVHPGALKYFKEQGINLK